MHLRTFVLRKLPQVSRKKKSPGFAPSVAAATISKLWRKLHGKFHVQKTSFPKSLHPWYVFKYIQTFSRPLTRNFSPSQILVTISAFYLIRALSSRRVLRDVKKPICTLLFRIEKQLSPGIANFYSADIRCFDTLWKCDGICAERQFLKLNVLQRRPYPLPCCLFTLLQRRERINLSDWFSRLQE